MKIAQTLAEATPALDFEIPLKPDDPRWVDLSEARGSGTIERLKKLFERQTRGRWLHAVFASHRGAGKTTELNRLASELSHRYFPVYFEANIEMNATRFEMEDLLLVIARHIEETMRKEGSPLDSDLLSGIEDWFSKVVLSDKQGKSYLNGVKAEAKAGANIPFYASLMASVTSSFRVESEHRESIQRTLRKFPGTLMTHVNSLLTAASESLEKDGRELLIFIDNMDRYEPKAIDELLVQSADRFKALACHLVVTPPIGLVLRPESQALESVFHCETMPTVRLREKKEAYDVLSGPGRGLLLEALGKRIDVDRLIPDETAQNRLIVASGGAIRELLELAQDATLEASGEVITADDVERTLDRRRQRLRDRIDANGWWDTLRGIAKTKRLAEDDQYLEVLFQRLAFQYNGEVWYDVHPLIAELPDLLPKKKAVRTGKGRKTNVRKKSK